MPIIVELSSSETSYGDELNNPLFDNVGTNTGKGVDFGDLETGDNSNTRFLYLRHNGEEPIYDAAVYLKAYGYEWGGYVEGYETSRFPNNPNFFKHGGYDEESYPNSSTDDYEFMRLQGYNNPEKGVRLHLDRNNDQLKEQSLGYDNKGLNFSAIPLPVSCMDYSKTTANTAIAGYIYPEPDNFSNAGKVGDEAKIGLSLNISEDVVGAGHVQFAVTVKYRYTQ